MKKIDFEKEAENILDENDGFLTYEDIKTLAKDLKKMYNYGIGYKRDRMFLSKEKHEKKYAPKRKTPAKTYKKVKK
jgi:flagellin-specific chaperone FliS